MELTQIFVCRLNAEYRILHPAFRGELAELERIDDGVEQSVLLIGWRVDGIVIVSLVVGVVGVVGVTAPRVRLLALAPLLQLLVTL